MVLRIFECLMSKECVPTSPSPKANLDLDCDWDEKIPRVCWLLLQKDEWQTRTTTNNKDWRKMLWIHTKERHRLVMADIFINYMRFQRKSWLMDGRTNWTTSKCLWTRTRHEKVDLNSKLLSGNENWCCSIRFHKDTQKHYASKFKGQFFIIIIECCSPRLYLLVK